VIRIGGFALAFMIAGCFGSPQTRYYSLVPIPSPPAGAASVQPLVVIRVTIPAVLDRESIVEWSGAERLEISNQNRWAAPLDGMMQRVLAEDLRQRLPGEVLLPGDPVSANDSWGLVLNVQHFAADTQSQQVALVADWSLIDPKTHAVIITRSQSLELSLPSKKTNDVVAAMSRAIAELSERIAHTLIAS
jgi:uncharacterized protein